MKHIPEDFIQATKAFLSSAKNILILSHKNPDGDAMGSGLALLQYFKEKNIEANYVLPNQPPAYLNWMPNAASIVNYSIDKEKAEAIVKQADLIFMLDFNHRSRLGELAEIVLASTSPKVMIDHHPYPEQIVDQMYNRTSASSTAEMVFEFITSHEHSDELSKSIAECLFVGIMTDTGNLSYNSSQPLTFEVVGNLLKSGIDKDNIIDRVYNNYSQHRLRLLGHSVNTKLKVLPEYQAAYIYLSRQDLEDYKFEQGDTEGFVNYPLSIKGIVFSAIFIEKDGFTKCSFRSKGTFPANKVSSDNFRGGGHLNAAGGEFKGSLKKATELFEQVLPNYKQYLNEK